MSEEQYEWSVQHISIQLRWTALILKEPLNSFRFQLVQASMWQKPNFVTNENASPSDVNACKYMENNTCMDAWNIKFISSVDQDSERVRYSIIFLLY
jgi:hypothetical protein